MTTWHISNRRARREVASTRMTSQIITDSLFLSICGWRITGFFISAIPAVSEGGWENQFMGSSDNLHYWLGAFTCSCHNFSISRKTYNALSHFVFRFQRPSSVLWKQRKSSGCWLRDSWCGIVSYRTGLSIWFCWHHLVIYPANNNRRTGCLWNAVHDWKYKVMLKSWQRNTYIEESVWTQ